MIDGDVDVTNFVALATSIVTLACAIATGPLKDFGWITSATRLLDLSEKLGDDGDEKVARSFLRELATSRVIRAKQMRVALSSGLPWTLNRLSLASLVVMGVSCIVIVVQNWTGGVHPAIAVAYAIALVSMCLFSLASFAVMEIRKLRSSKNAPLRSEGDLKQRQTGVNNDVDN